MLLNCNKKDEKDALPNYILGNCLLIFFFRLKKEIERIHRTWEKKFAILQQRYLFIYFLHLIHRNQSNIHDAIFLHAVFIHSHS